MQAVMAGALGSHQAGGGIPAGKSACPVITSVCACHRHACMRHSQQLWSWLPPRQEELVRVGMRPPPRKEKGTHGASDAGREAGRRKQALLMPVMGQAAKRTNQGRRGGRKGQDRPRQQRWLCAWKVEHGGMGTGKCSRRKAGQKM